MKLRLIWLPLLLLLCAPRLSAQNSLKTPPESLAQLALTAKSALQQRTPTQLSASVENTPERRFAWFKETATTKWEVAPLSSPLSENTPLRWFMVFSKWHTCEGEGDHIYPIQEKEGRWEFGDEITERNTLGYRILHHTMNVKADPEKATLQVEDQVQFQKREGNALGLCVVRLSPDFAVESLTYNSNPLRFTRSGGILLFTPPTEEAFTLTMRYAGKVMHQGSDYFLPEEFTMNSYWYPHIARLPATLTLTTTPPKGWRALTHGEITARKQNADGTWTVTFDNKIPISYFTLNMGIYIVHTQKMAGIDLYLYLRKPRSEQEVKRVFETTEASLLFFQKNFSPYPYSRYTLLETAGQFGGALEGYSFATFASRAFGATTHEIAHTWWGGIVPCAYTQSMWNESFAVYSDMLFQRSKQASPILPPDSLFARRKGMAGAFKQVAVANAYSTDSQAHNATGYGKGALVLRVLEEEIGQETMLRTVQEFIKSHKRGEAAEWNDIETAVKNTVGKDFRWFFEQWTERTGLPTPRLTNVRATPIAGGYSITGTFVQPKENVYRLSLPLALLYRDGSREEIVRIQGTTTEFRFTVPAAPLEIRVDTRGTLPLSIEGAEDSLRHNFTP